MPSSTKRVGCISSKSTDLTSAFCMLDVTPLFKRALGRSFALLFKAFFLAHIGKMYDQNNCFV